MSRRWRAAGSAVWVSNSSNAVHSLATQAGVAAYAASTRAFAVDGTGRVRALRLVEVAQSSSGFTPISGTEREVRCDLVLLAMGFTGADRGDLLTGLGTDMDQRGNVARDRSYATSVPGVFVAGDMGRGQSLIVWSIAEGRSAAAAHRRDPADRRAAQVVPHAGHPRRPGRRRQAARHAG